jgi:hypothetical protein
VTAGIAVAAGIVAVWSIRSQREIARKRAALDLFFKTEMDKTAMEVSDNDEAAIKKIPSNSAYFPQFKATKEYEDVLAYLNILELIAVGIHTRVLDEAVCFDFYADDLMDACRDCQRLITHLQREDQNKSPLTYVELERLAKSWKVKNDKLLALVTPRDQQRSNVPLGGAV